MKLTYAILFALASIAVGGDGTHYSDAFYSHYPVRGRVFDLMGYALEVPTVAHNNNGQRVATVRRTRGDKYPYEDQKCEITVEGDGLETPQLRPVSLRMNHTHALDLLPQNGQQRLWQDRCGPFHPYRLLPESAHGQSRDSVSSASPIQRPVTNRRTANELAAEI